MGSLPWLAPPSLPLHVQLNSCKPFQISSSSSLQQPHQSTYVCKSWLHQMLLCQWSREDRSPWRWSSCACRESEVCKTYIRRFSSASLCMMSYLISSLSCSLKFKRIILLSSMSHASFLSFSSYFSLLYLDSIYAFAFSARSFVPFVIWFGPGYCFYWLVCCAAEGY